MTPARQRLLLNALEARGDFFQQCAKEQTDCYRLFHGTAEGESGLTIDRYGEQLLIQAFHNGLDQRCLDEISTFYQQQFGDIRCIYYHDRTHRSRARRIRLWGANSPLINEIGLTLNADLSFESQDPLLFLDFRAARRKIADIASNLQVLNTFSYTGAIGLHALKHKANHLTQLDFSSFALEQARINAGLNPLSPDSITYLHDDFFVACRQFANLPVGSRSKKHFTQYKQQTFDLIILDPPGFAKSPFGTVDLIRDYQSLLKPCLHALNTESYLLCTNNIASVNVDNWISIVSACCTKNGRTIDEMEVIRPDEDFPSFDDQPPLKTLLIKFH